MTTTRGEEIVMIASPTIYWRNIISATTPLVLTKPNEAREKREGHLTHAPVLQLGASHDKFVIIEATGDVTESVKV